MASLRRAAFAIALVLRFVYGGNANQEAKRLYDHLFSRYDRLIRPVARPGDVITVKLGLKLAQLIAVVSGNIRSIRSFSGEIPSFSPCPR